jgi:hypothetical protein
VAQALGTDQSLTWTSLLGVSKPGGDGRVGEGVVHKVQRRSLRLVDRITR